MLNIKKELEIISRTGKIILGYRQTYLSVLNRKAKLVLTAKNCPEGIEKRLGVASKLTGIPVMKMDINSDEVGYILGKPFRVAVLSVIDAGSSSILEEVAPEVE